jgi:signal transduction histidine kinase
MGEAGGELYIRTHRIGDAVFVRFRDQGPGIPLENREKIFDPLFTTRAEGTGLGLAMSNKAVTAHGGKLSVRDAPGRGTEFVIRLPVVAAALPTEPAPEPAASGG